jgi:opacity protein-like surface antigen
MTTTCSRRWTIGEGMMPVGFQWNFIPHHRIQPFLIGHGGYMYSSHAIPIQDAGHFNFAFDFGTGIEIFRCSKRSLRLDYRYHHISNQDTASVNPGIDNGLAEITYCFGR